VTDYLCISALQEPFDNTLDGSGRPEYAFNVLAMKRSSSGSFLLELMGILVAAGLGVAGRTIVASAKATIPTSGPCISIIATGGTPPIGTHNDGPSAYRRPGAQITARADTALEAEALAQAAYVALVGIRNRAVSA
jgi:hypothetical protein